jgi:hypothetical protein
VSHIVFKIGPLLQPEGVSAYFVYPGQGNDRAFFGSDDASGLKEILSAYDPSELAVERQLASSAQPLGIASRAMTEDEIKQLGVMAFELGVPGAFSDIHDQTSFHQLGVAAKIFDAAAPWMQPFSSQTIELVLRGSAVRTFWARIVGRTFTPGVVLYDNPFSVDRIVEAVERGRWEEVANAATLGITLQNEPRFAAEVMQRVYAIPKVPTPLKIENGTRLSIDDLDALVLAAVLRAISVLSSADRVSHSEVSTESLELTAVASLQTL